MSDLLNLLSLEAKELSLRFQKSSIEGRGTPQEVSDRREVVVKELLQKYFPFPFRLAKGNVIDSYGGRSASIDCLVLNPDHPYTVSNDGLFSILLADGVDYAVEVKPALNSKSEIERALHQIVTVKDLTRVRHGKLGGGSANDKKIPCAIFSDESYEDMELLVRYVVEYYEQHRVARQRQFDLIVVNNRALLLNLRKGSYFFPVGGSLAEGINILESGANTLAAFLVFLNMLPLSSPRISPEILPLYIDRTLLGSIRTYPDLNERLERIEPRSESK